MSSSLGDIVDPLEITQSRSKIDLGRWSSRKRLSFHKNNSSPKSPARRQISLHYQELGVPLDVNGSMENILDGENLINESAPAYLQ